MLVDDKKKLLIFFLLLVISFFAYFSYQQNKVIGVLNQEIIKQAQKRHKMMLNKYAVEKELERIRDRYESLSGDTLRIDFLNMLNDVADTALFTPSDSSEKHVEINDSIVE